jgi:hypothetical protein
MNKAVLVVVVFLGAQTGFGQTSRGTVSGIVTDSSGAVLPGATVTLTGNETGVGRPTATNEDGIYRFEAVELGNYSLKVEAPNFGAMIKQNIQVSANQVARIDSQLSPRGPDVTVDVTAQLGALLQSETPVRGGNFDSLQIAELPFANRNPVSLGLTLPGVSTNRFAYGETSYSVNGARGRSNNFLINGIENNDISVAGQGFQIRNPDAVRDVSVQTSNKHHHEGGQQPVSRFSRIPLRHHA